MFLNFNARILYLTTFCFAVFSFATVAFAAMDPRFELDPQTLSGLKKQAKPRKAPLKRHPQSREASSSPVGVKAGIYTVKRGDHLFRILMRDYGLSNSEAESFIEEIKRENNIYDIKRLKIGQKISIPAVRRGSDGSLQLSRDARDTDSWRESSGSMPEQSFKLESQVPPLSEEEALKMAHNVWNRIVPPAKEQQSPLTLKTSTFSLTLDPARYPGFARIDGGRIVLDQRGTIPPLVKSLIEEKGDLVRIVTEAPSGTGRFMGALLEAGGFYSVEENFSMEFGVDPKLTVQADFKVEKTAESLLKQDVVLVNSGRTSLPPSLGEFLKKEGFMLYEPFASLSSFARRDSRAIHYISSKKQPELIDSILSSFAVAPERNRKVDVFATEDNGISLSVGAERYFERAGQRYIVTGFDGDPTNYTLFRILEAKGYKVVILDAQDDFRKITEKIVDRMDMKGFYAQHGLLQDQVAGYSLQMSGFKLDDALLPGGGIFLTDRSMDRIVRDLVSENGFSINNW